MKRSTKILSIVIIFFLIIASVIIARTMIGNHFKKKFGKRPPPGIMITEVMENRFFEKIETFGTAVSNRNDSFRIKKDELLEELDLNNFVNKGDVIVKLKSGDIIAPFSGVLGYTGLTEDIFVSDKTIIITLDDTKVIYSDIKIPENYSSVIQTGLPIEAKVSSFKDKTFNGEIDFISSRINADTRSLLTRIKIDNSNYELISGSLLEVSIIFNLRNSLGVPDTSVMMEGDKAFVAGADIKEFANFSKEQGKKLAKNGQDKLFNLIENFSKPVIAAINGFALGGGLELAMACHIRIASENAKMGLPEVSLGVIPGYGGTQRLAQLIGKGKALELITTAQMINSNEALKYGLINHLVTQENLIQKCLEISKHIIKNSPNAISAAIKSINAGYSKDLNGYNEEIES